MDLCKEKSCGQSFDVRLFPKFYYVDNVGTANMLGDIPDKKSQLDLKPFGEGVPVMSHTFSP